MYYINGIIVILVICLGSCFGEAETPQKSTNHTVQDDNKKPSKKPVNKDEQDNNIERPSKRRPPNIALQHNTDRYSQKTANKAKSISSTKKTSKKSINNAEQNKLTSFNIGDFSYRIEKFDENYLIAYFFNNIPITRIQTIKFLEDEADFRYIINKSIANLPLPEAKKDNYMLQSPLINSQVKDDEFFFIAHPHHTGSSIDKTFYDYLSKCKSSNETIKSSEEFHKRFWQIFSLGKKNNFKSLSIGEDNKLNYGSVVFKGGYPPQVDSEQIMVSPCPLYPDINKNDDISKIYTFTKYLESNLDEENVRRLHGFWFAVGQTAKKMFHEDKVFDLDGKELKNASIYLNTHGYIKYLHFRIETEPRYYEKRFKQILSNAEKSKQFFEKNFAF